MATEYISLKFTLLSLCTLLHLLLLPQSVQSHVLKILHFLYFIFSCVNLLQRNKIFIYKLVVLVVKNLPAHAGDEGSIPGSGRPPGEGNGSPHQYSCLGIPMDREAGWATLHGVAKSQTQLRVHACACVHTHTHTHTHT